MNLKCIYLCCISQLLHRISLMIYLSKYLPVSTCTCTHRPWAPLRRLYLISGSVSDLPIAALIAGASLSVQHNAEKMQPTCSYTRRDKGSVSASKSQSRARRWGTAWRLMPCFLSLYDVWMFGTTTCTSFALHEPPTKQTFTARLAS